MNFEQAESTNIHREISATNSLQSEAREGMAKFDFNRGTDRKLPAGFSAAEDLLGGENLKGLKDDVADRANKDAANGGQVNAGEYHTELTKDVTTNRRALTTAADNLTHERAMQVLEDMRQQHGRLTEGELRKNYVGANMEQKATILYALENFDTFAKAGNHFGADWSESAIDAADISSAKAKD